MDEHDQLLYQLIVEIRGAFHELAALSDVMNADVGITAAMRAVIETLHESGAQTVPQIALAKNVSRQHIQVLTDALAEKLLIRFQANPGHKRSKLLALSPAGEQVFSDIRRREAAALAELTKNFENRALFSTIATVAELRKAVRGLS